MTLDDIDNVVELDRLSFPTPWPARTYRYELMDNNRSMMQVLEPADGSRRLYKRSGLWGWADQVRGVRRAAPDLAGYSGMWHVGDEAHVSTIAVHPDWRGLKLGELLLWSMARRAITSGARLLTLEVRVSNDLAQNLYRKYGFEVMGRRKGYYHDNGEDAYMMGITPLDHAYRNRIVEFGKALTQHVKVSDRL
jgi:ribosomal-protein-alanine N-acetyltransferase